MAASLQCDHRVGGHKRVPRRYTVPRLVEVHLVRNPGVKFDVAICQSRDDVQVRGNALAVSRDVWVNDVATHARVCHGAAPRFEQVLVNVDTLAAQLIYALYRPLVRDEGQVLFNPCNPVLWLKLALNDLKER